MTATLIVIGFLAIDTWNDLEGLQKFMGDPQLAEAFGASTCLRSLFITGTKFGG
jgi:hypothetical protein